MSPTLRSSVDLTRLAEHITLLWMLDKEPGRPEENLAQAQFIAETHDPPRQLTFKQERDLVDHLAFLSAFRDDPDKVIAICVEEHQNPEGLVLRLAMNTGDLETVKEGLAKIVALLQQVAAAQMSDLSEDSLLNEVINLNRYRILSRLRSRHARGSKRARDKPPVVTRLVKAVSEASSNKKPGFTRLINVEELKERTKELEMIFQQLEAMPADKLNSVYGTQLLSELLVSAFKLSLRDDFGILLEAIPTSGLFSPGTGSVLRTALGKLGRYYSASRFLYAAARKLTVFKNIRVEGVSRSARVAMPLLLHQVSSEEVKLIGRTLQARSGSRLVSVEAQLREHLASSVSRRKVHAEIQLIFHYELTPKNPRPRVICSSKSSCFLCNLFIKLHGKFYIARTHGVLYHAWALPNPSLLPPSSCREMTKIINKMNLALEDTLRLTIRKTSMRRCHPNESVFIEPALWTPSAQSLTTKPHLQDPGSVSIKAAICEDQLDSGNLRNQSQVGQGVAKPEENDTLTDPKDGLDPTKTIQASPVDLEFTWAEHLGPTDDIQSSMNRMPPAHLLQTHLLSSSLPRISPSPKPSITDSPINQLSTWYSRTVQIKYEHLVQGRLIWRELAGAESSLRVSTPHIHISLSSDTISGTAYEEERERGTEIDRRCCVSVKWLEDDEEPKKVVTGQPNVVDLNDADVCLEDTLRHGAAHSPEELYLVRKVDIVAIKFHLSVRVNSPLGSYIEGQGRLKEQE